MELLRKLRVEANSCRVRELEDLERVIVQLVAQEEQQIPTRLISREASRIRKNEPCIFQHIDRILRAQTLASLLQEYRLLEDVRVAWIDRKYLIARVQRKKGRKEQENGRFNGSTARCVSDGETSNGLRIVRTDVIFR